MPPQVALIVALPAATPLASAPGVIVAAAGLLLDQVTFFVQLLLLESTYVQVAVNCCVFPAVVEAIEGVTSIPLRLTAVELNVAVTVQLAAGMVPEYVVVPLPPHPLTLVRIDPIFAVTVHE